MWYFGEPSVFNIKLKIKNLLCCPVLNPQIVGDPLLPGAVTTNWSMVQSPIEPPSEIEKRQPLKAFSSLCAPRQ